jgi:hypothetical protein
MSTIGKVGWSHHVPIFLGVVDDQVVQRIVGLPPRERLSSFVEGIAALGGSESGLQAALDRDGNDAALLARAGRWYDGRHRRQESQRYWLRLAALEGAPAELRAEADWKRGRQERFQRPRDPRAPLVFAKTHVGTRWAHLALAVATVVKQVSPAELADALQVEYEAAHESSERLGDLVYLALAAHHYDPALESAQQWVRLTKNANAGALDALAEVYYYRHESTAAIAMGARAVALAPTSEPLRADLTRFSRSDGTAGELVEGVRRGGLEWLPRFYGDAE